MQQKKRILSIEVKHIDDTDPDTSYLGKYSGNPADDYSIDRNHSADCPRFWANNDILDDARECDCTGRRDSRNTYQYFNPGSVEAFDADASWIPADVTDKRAYWAEAMRQNALQDYARMEAYNADEWSFIGIDARAEIVIGGVCQTIKSGGLWGIESDSEESHFCETEQDELAALRGILNELGFSKRAIAAAVKAGK